MRRRHPARGTGWQRGLHGDPPGNYWGTSDSTQIADWIYDHSDGDTGILVDFSSFSEQPIPVERTSFGGLKARR